MGYGLSPAARLVLATHAPLAPTCILERATQGTLSERFHFLVLYLCPSKLLPLSMSRKGGLGRVHRSRTNGWPGEVEDSGLPFSTQKNGKTMKLENLKDRAV